MTDTLYRWLSLLLPIIAAAAGVWSTIQFTRLDGRADAIDVGVNSCVNTPGLHGPVEAGHS